MNLNCSNYSGSEIRKKQLVNHSASTIAGPLAISTPDITDPKLNYKVEINTFSTSLYGIWEVKFINMGGAFD